MSMWGHEVLWAQVVHICSCVLEEVKKGKLQHIDYIPAKYT